eukprot:PhM_4_TR13247/c0_g1_i1/m.43981
MMTQVNATPHPHPPPPRLSISATSSMTFFDHVDASRKAHVLRLATDYRGREKMLLMELCKQYPRHAPELAVHLSRRFFITPHFTAPTRKQRLRAAIEMYFPDAPASVLVESTISEDKIWRALFDKYSASAALQEEVRDAVDPATSDDLDDRSRDELCAIVRRQRCQLSATLELLKQLKADNERLQSLVCIGDNDDDDDDNEKGEGGEEVVINY